MSIWEGERLDGVSGQHWDMEEWWRRGREMRREREGGNTVTLD